MSHLKEFQHLIKEANTFPKDELRDYYLAPARKILESHPEITEEIFDDKSAIMSVVEQQIKKHNHTIRQIHLDTLAMEIAMMTPREILNYQNVDGDSVIHLTTRIMCYSVSILDVFKETGANFSLINKNGETPLIKIANTYSLDDLKFIHGYTSPRLLDHRDLISGSTALMHAVKSRKIANIFFLLEMGSSLYIRDNLGMTILDLIQDEEYKMKSERAYYRELERFVNFFSQKQMAEQNIKELSLSSQS
jgi:hypothetical protein